MRLTKLSKYPLEAEAVYEVTMTSPGVREPLYPDTERDRRMMEEEDEDMEIIITKIQEDTAYRSTSRLVRIIQVLGDMRHVITRSVIR